MVAAAGIAAPMRRPGRSGRRILRLALMAPAVLMVAGFVLVPTLMAVVDSFRSFGDWTFENYRTIVTQAPYPKILWNTLTIAFFTMLFSVALAVPAAAFLSARKSRAATIVLGLIAATLWISILVKIYAWQVLLARTGPINDMLQGAGLTEGPLTLLYTRGAVVTAMVQVMVPYACVLLVAGMKRVDWELITASRTLGAGLPMVFREVYWPQVRFTVVTTAFIIFVSASGFFVAPALLGGTGEVMLGMKMHSDLINQYDSGLSATVGTALTVTLLLLAWVALKLTGTSFRRLAEEVAT